MSKASKFTGLSFDASTVAPAVPLEAFPAGDYNVAITDGEVKPTADGTGQRFAFELTVLEGEFKGRKVWDGLNIKNKSAQAQEIAHQQLSAICHATGVIKITNVGELLNKAFIAKIGFEGQRVDGDKTYDARNTFKGAKPAGGAVAGAPVAASAPKWAKKDAAAAPAGVAAPAKPAAPSAPKGPPKPPAPAAKKDDRKFFAYVNEETQGPLPADEALALPEDTMLCLEGTEDWKAASEFKAAPAPAPVVPAGKTPPWAKKG